MLLAVDGHRPIRIDGALPIQAHDQAHRARYARPGESFSEAEEIVIWFGPRAVRARERVKQYRACTAGGRRVDDSVRRRDERERRR